MSSGVNPSRSTLVILAVAALALPVAGCGSAEETPGASPTSTGVEATTPTPDEGEGPVRKPRGSKGESGPDEKKPSGRGTASEQSGASSSGSGNNPSDAGGDGGAGESTPSDASGSAPPIPECADPDSAACQEIVAIAKGEGDGGTEVSSNECPPNLSKRQCAEAKQAVEAAQGEGTNEYGCPPSLTTAECEAIAKSLGAS